MCKTIEVSLFTLFVVVCVFITIFREKRFAAIVLLLVGSMQIVDVILWFSIRCKLSYLNLITSKYLIPTVFVVQLIGVYYFSNYRNDLYEVALILSLLNILQWSPDCKVTSIAKTGYLEMV